MAMLLVTVTPLTEHDIEDVGRVHVCVHEKHPSGHLPRLGIEVPRR